MKKITLFIFSFFCLAGKAQSTFQKTYGSTAAEAANAVSQTNDGGYIITGKSAGDLYLVRTTEDGSLRWAKTFGASQISEGFAVQETDDRGFIAVGYTGYPLNNSPPHYNIYLVKIDSSGNLEWSKTYGESFGIGIGIKQVADKGYIICGNGDSQLIKTDSNGTIQWAKRYIGGLAMSFQQTGDQGFIIAGVSSNFKNDNSDNAYLLKTSSDGSVEWANAYGSPGFHGGSSVQQTPDGGYIIAGENDYKDADAYLLKISSAGALEWTKTYGYNRFETAYSIDITNDGGFIMCGELGDYGNGVDVYLVRTASDGSLLWTKSFGNKNWELGNCVHQTKDGGFIIAGQTSAYDAQGDIYLIKTDSEGNSHCNEDTPTTIVGSEGMLATAVAVENVLTGENNPLTQIGSRGVENIICETVSINEIAESNFTKIFPNPSSGIFTIHMRNSQAEAQVTVRDVLGNCLLEKNCQGETSRQIDLSCQPTGIYFVEVLSGTKRIVRKVAVQ